MKRSLIYIVVLLVVISCTKDTSAPSPIFSEGGLISFTTRVNTKTPIITELNGEQFGVYAYKFPNLTTWGTYKTAAAPDLFLNLKVTCDDAGACSYDVGDTDTDINGREQWELSKKYSYFAYYPYLSSAPSVPDSEYGILSDPYIDYSLPLSADLEVNPDDLLDIMTAKVTDWSATRGTVVRFEFYHRLFLIELYGYNFNSEMIKITDLSMTISGIRYNKARIFMDYDIPSEYSSDKWTKDDTVEFPIINQTSPITIDGNSEAELSTDKNIVLIPQKYLERIEDPYTKEIRDDESGLNVQLDLTYEITLDNKTTTRTVRRSATYNSDFIERNKYTLNVNFVGEEVLLVTANAAPWDKKDVTHIFD